MTPLTDKQETLQALQAHNGLQAYQRMLASEQARVAECNTPEARPLARQAHKATVELDIRRAGQQESEGGDVPTAEVDELYTTIFAERKAFASYEVMTDAQIKELQTENAALRQQVAGLRGALEGCIADCTLSTVYVGDFYRDATKRVKARAAEALASGEG